MWQALQHLALSLVKADDRFQNETEQDLHAWITGSGYPAAPQAHQHTLELIHVYAASLRNAGGPGPGMLAFAEMVTKAVAPSISDNAVTRLSAAELAQRCGDLLDRAKAPVLARHSRVDYREQLRRQAAEEDQGHHAVLPRCVTSVARFIDLLVNRYGGSAAHYHQTFAGTTPASAPCMAVRQAFDDLAHLPQIGVAVGMNFIKDSQVSGLAHLPLADLRHHVAGWFVKPDKHVMRMALAWTGRLTAASLDPAELFHMDDRIVLKAYGEQPRRAPAPIYRLHTGRPSSERGPWHCIEDLHHEALRHDIPPLALDRLLYLVGSGRYKDGRRRLNTPVEERYGRFLREVCGLR